MDINNLISALAEAEQNYQDAANEQEREYWYGKIYEIEQVLDNRTGQNNE